MNNSLKAYFDPENQRKFNSHSGMILRELHRLPRQHSYQLADRLGLTNEAVKKRLSDLISMDLIEVCGETIVFRNTVSLYNIKDQLNLFPIKKISLRKWLNINYPNILNEFEKL